MLLVATLAVYKLRNITTTADALQRVCFASFVPLMTDCRVLLSSFVRLSHISVSSCLYSEPRLRRHSPLHNLHSH